MFLCNNVIHLETEIGISLVNQAILAPRISSTYYDATNVR